MKRLKGLALIKQELSTARITALVVGSCLFLFAAYFLNTLQIPYLTLPEWLKPGLWGVVFLAFVALVFLIPVNKAEELPAFIDVLKKASTTICSADADDQMRFIVHNQFASQPLEACQQFIPNILVDVKRARKNGAFMTFYNLDGRNYRVNFQPSLDHDGHVDIAFVDVTRDQEQTQELDLSSRIFHNTSDAIIVADARRFIKRINHQFSVITGYSNQDIAGMRLGFPVKPEDKIPFYRQVIKSLKDDGFWCGDIWSKRKNGEMFSGRMKVTLNHTPDGAVHNYIAYFSDVTELIRSEEELRYLANHDTLTGLPNRRLFFDRIDQAIKRARRANGQFAIFFVDLDNFKAINDELGHPVGDELLISVASRLLSVVRATDTVARLAGDEFTIVAEQIDSCEEVKSIAEKIVKCFDPAFVLGDHQVYTSASVGVCIYPADGENVMQLVKGADSAMYKAKNENGRGSYFMLGSHGEKPRQVDDFFVNELRSALDRGQMQMVYQPQVSLQTGEIIGCEALLRWQHQQLGQVQPRQFMPIAAQEGVLSEMELWVLTQVCQQMAFWLERKLPVQFITINITEQQITNTGFLDKLREVLAQTGLPPDKLLIEISELSLVDNLENGARFIQALKDLGVRTVVDDFGASHREFGYLKELPVTGIKIDNQHLQHIKQGQQGDLLFRAMLGMGELLDINVIAEGVERGMQEHYLQDIGCRYAQGYLYGKPMIPESFQQLFNGASEVPATTNDTRAL